MNAVRKGVIIVAGLGTRFLPVTKAVPKELLPVLDKPVIHYIVEEMAASGVTEILFVTNAKKRALEDYFSRDLAFEDALKKNGKLDRIQSVIDLNNAVRFFYTEQPEPLGNGHALRFAREFVGGEPFVCSDGDSIIDSRVPVTKQLLAVFAKQRASVIGVQKIADKKAMTKYGNIYGDFVTPPLPSPRRGGTGVGREGRLYRVERFAEKPPEDKVSPHGLIAGGMRYIFTKDIWDVLEAQKPGRDGEIWLADAANALASKKPFFAYEYEGEYFDTGTPAGLLKTTMYFAGKRSLL